MEYRSTTLWTKILAVVTGFMAIFTLLLALNATKQIEEQRLPDLKLNVTMEPEGVVAIGASGVPIAPTPTLKITNLGKGVYKLKLKISDKSKVLIQEKETLVGRSEVGSSWDVSLDKGFFTPNSTNLLHAELEWKSEIGGKFYRKWELKVQVTEDYTNFRLIDDPIVTKMENPWEIIPKIKNRLKHVFKL